MPSEKKPVQIGGIVEESLKLIRATIPKTVDINWNIQCRSEMVLADPTEIDQMIMNLCANSVHAVGDGGSVNVGLSTINFTGPPPGPLKELGPGNYVKLNISDNGAGMEPETLERIFEPYFTTKEVDEGIGMGMAVVYGIVKDFDGAIWVQSSVGQGTNVEILFPLYEAASSDRGKAANGSVKMGRILFLDDEAAISKMVGLLLKRMGYEAICETDPVKALAEFARNPDGFDLVFTDMAMPKMPGDRFARKIREIRPDLPIILCTGHSDRINEKLIRESGIHRVVTKPFDKSELTRIIEAALSENR
jgi:CheY-like chemotaxis protein